MDHSNCTNPEECKAYEYYAELLADPDQSPLPEKIDTMVSVSLDSAQLHVLHAAAKAREMTISQFVRESALRAASLPYVKWSGIPPVTTYTA